MLDEENESGCGCTKGEGVVSMGGWHLFVSPKDYCFVLNNVVQHPQDSTKILCTGTCHSTRDKANCTYGGKLIAFERCPEHWAGIVTAAEKKQGSDDMDGKDAGF